MNIEPDAQPLLPSNAIAVGHFELALVWPVFVQPRRDSRGALLNDSVDPHRNHDFLTSWVNLIRGSGDQKWYEVKSEYPPMNGSEAEPAYAEFCYFHPFVRHFLYSSRDDIRKSNAQAIQQGEALSEEQIRNSINRNLRILERNDLKELMVEYDLETAPRQYNTLRSRFSITHCWLYLFDTQVAMLELKLQHQETQSLEGPPLKEPAFNLGMVLKLKDIVRRVYAPYWSVFPMGGQTAHFAGHCPRKLELRFKPGADGSNREPVISTFGNFCRDDLSKDRLLRCPDAIGANPSAWLHREHVFRHREPWSESVFQELLKPIEPVKLQALPGDANNCVLQYEQIEDERVPVFSYVAVKEPRQITTGDWIRLAALDDPGDSWRYPYSPLFLGENPLQGMAYDRFWHPTGRPPGSDQYHSTRWLCTGYGFVGVGPYDPSGQDFFSNAHSGALAHCRHHYFALGMIAQFQRASLLRFKHALAEAAEHLFDEEPSERTRRGKFREKLDGLMKEFLKFRTLYWFSEVSNQVQGRELFELFNQHLRLQPLFTEVAQDIESSANLIRSWYEEEQNEEAHKQSNYALLLTIVAAIFLSITPALDWAGNGLIWPAIFLFVILIVIILHFVELPKEWATWNHWRRTLAKLWKQPKRRLAALVILVSICGIAYSWRDPLAPSLPEDNAGQTSGESSSTTQPVGEPLSVDQPSGDSPAANTPAATSSGSNASAEATAPQ